MRRRWFRLASVALLLAVVSAGIWLSRSGAHSTDVRSAAAESREPKLPIVETVRPRAGGISRAIRQPASIQSFETVDLYAMVSGYLESQAVDIGSRIKKGEVLAVIHVPRDAKAVEEASAVVEQARAAIAQADALVQVAEAQRRAAEAATNQAVSDVDRLKAERMLAEKEFARARGLAESRAVDYRLVDERQSALDAARAAERTAELAIETARARALAAAAEVKKAKADAVQARTSLRVAEARRDRLQVNLQYARIVAPFDGVVTHRTFHKGALIHSAMEGGKQPLLTVKRTDLMRVVVLVPDRDVALTRVGDRAAISVDALNDRSFEGVLARIARAEDAERLMRVEIDLPNPDLLLYDGMYGKATITLGRNPRSLSVPTSCVVEHIGRSHGAVLVVRDGVVHRVEVQLSGDDGTLAEILAGIKPDENLVLRAGTFVKDGLRVATRQ